MCALDADRRTAATQGRLRWERGGAVSVGVVPPWAAVAIPDCVYDPPVTTTRTNQALGIRGHGRGTATPRWAAGVRTRRLRALPPKRGVGRGRSEHLVGAEARAQAVPPAARQRSITRLRVGGSGAGPRGAVVACGLHSSQATPCVPIRGDCRPRRHEHMAAAPLDGVLSR